MSNGSNGPNTASKSRDWVFTLNNYDEKWEMPADPSITYYIYQREVGEEGTPHLQGFIQFKNPRALGGLKKLIPRAHWEQRRGSVQQAINYSSKEETREEGCTPVIWGEPRLNDKPGKRNDLDQFKEDVQSGMDWSDIIESHSSVVAKHPGFVALYRNKHAKRKRLDGDLLNWQIWVRDLVDGPIDDRAIFWFFDPIGGRGKTYMSRWLQQERSVFYLNGGKGNDITFAYNGEPIVIFDYSRDHQEYVGYGAMEQLKNGMFFSPKYQSMTKVFDIPHVICFANFMIDDSKLSKDRINIITFEQDGIWWKKPHTPIKERID